MSTTVPTASNDATDHPAEATDHEAAGFESLGVPAALARALADRGISAPFPIQQATVPPALAGRDVCGRAPTGSGKTLAFGLPVALRVGRARPHAPRALVLAPTRELAAQIADELRQLADPDQHIACFYGGVGFSQQLRALREGVDVAVACPGRLADLISQGHVSLAEVDLVVLDEADRMADMGFLPEVRRLLDACAEQRQTLLFSATLDGDVDVIIRRYMRDPVRHEEAGADSDGPVAEHVFWSVERPDRVDATALAVKRTGPTVVFCRTKRGADRVARQLGARGVSAVAIHGDRSQNQRERALEDFRSGRARAIVATDVAARGIHVDGVTCVVHFDPTDDPKDYVHRSGRTGRAGAAGVVVSLVPAESRRDVARQQRGLGREAAFIDPDPEALPEGEPFVASAPPARRPSGNGNRNGNRNGKGNGGGGGGGGGGRRRRGDARGGSSGQGGKPRNGKPRANGSRQDRSGAGGATAQPGRSRSRRSRSAGAPA